MAKVTAMTSREPTNRRSEARAMLAGLLVVAGIFVAFQGGGWLLLGTILIAAGLGHGLVGRDNSR